MHDIVIVNTSPLFYLHRIKKLNLLKKLYKEIIIPESVASELEEGEKRGEDVPNIKNYQWIEIKTIEIRAILNITPDLGKGEAGVLALGLKYKKPLLILDDLLARKIAKLNNFKITGTAGILLKAKQEGLIPKVSKLLSELNKCGFYISDSLMNDILKLANE